MANTLIQLLHRTKCKYTKIWMFNISYLCCCSVRPDVVVAVWDDCVPLHVRVEWARSRYRASLLWVCQCLHVLSFCALTKSFNKKDLFILYDLSLWTSSGTNMLWVNVDGCDWVVHQSVYLLSLFFSFRYVPSAGGVYRCWCVGRCSHCNNLCVDLLSETLQQDELQASWNPIGTKWSSHRPTVQVYSHAERNEHLPRHS